ncbi:MAG: helix-turn-helix transcriptional regulator [Clostridia bacterium]|nr:helix-turn-helix transcriptional regulator [Clostridia bacterium]
MRLSYDKLWEVMKNNKLRKGELAAAAEVSEYIMSKLVHDEPVSLEVMMKFCKIFHCDIGELVEITEED